MNEFLQLFLFAIVTGLINNPYDFNRRNFWYLAAVLLPNLLHPAKLWRNIRHPILEWVHLSHYQYPYKSQPGIWVVEHRLWGNLKTVDVVRETTWAAGLLPLLRQIFNPRFYVGHRCAFPGPFELIERFPYREGVAIKNLVVRALDNEKARTYRRLETAKAIPDGWLTEPQPELLLAYSM